MAVRTPVARLAEGSTRLAPETFQYLCRVLRMRVGDRFVAFDPEARTEADAEIEAIDGSRASVRIGPLRAGQVVAETPLVLVYALAKGDKIDAVVRDATELGATRIVIARTHRSVVKADDAKAEAKLERFRRIAEQAARQSGRADPPIIDGVFDWDRALEVAANDARSCFCLDVRATVALGVMLSPALAARSSIAFAIGPEGGLTDDEVTVARTRGFELASLGRFVLRTETVAAAVLGAVRVLTSATGPDDSVTVPSQT